MDAHRTSSRSGKKLRFAIALVVAAGMLMASASASVPPPAGHLLANNICSVPGRLTWEQVAPQTYQVAVYFRANSAAGECGSIAVAGFTINAAGLTSNVGRCTQTSSPSNQTIDVDLQGTLAVDGSGEGPLEFKPYGPTLFPGMPMPGTYIIDGNPRGPEEIVTRLAGNCPPAGSTNAVLYWTDYTEGLP